MTAVIVFRLKFVVDEQVTTSKEPKSLARSGGFCFANGAILKGPTCEGMAGKRDKNIDQ
jgi:hypothetical protein